MPTALLDLDVDALPPGLTVPERYERALVLIRLRGRPVGQATLPVVDGRLAVPDLREALVTAAGWPLWRHWVHERLGWSDPAPAPLPAATIAVCTRERPDDLRNCLAALQRLPADGQEIVVIDNAPRTDATRAVAAEFPEVRYVVEPRAGLDVARNRALREARHEIVAFTDDDAIADPAWLRALLAGFADPRVLAATGLTMPAELETKAQEWFERHSGFGRGFFRRTFQAETHNPLVAGPVGAGVNMAVRRSVVELVGPFDEALDAGTPTQSGGDHDMFSRILSAGYRIAYEPGALVRHRHRREWKELRQTLYGYGVGVYAAWTKSLVVEREWSVPRIAWGWFRHDQARALARSLLRRPGSAPLELVWAELRGCAAGPAAYFRSRRARAREAASA